MLMIRRTLKWGIEPRRDERQGIKVGWVTRKWMGGRSLSIYLTIRIKATSLVQFSMAVMVKTEIATEKEIL